MRTQEPRVSSQGRRRSKV
uniref:Uncharacterized protein n=1 Tax=Nymphaea colorata TaxID=210225 RepID=A0A5K1GVP1_9MAGN